LILLLYQITPAKVSTQWREFVIQLFEFVI
jgi:hypothetical protein